jgi:hypothetical protein
MVDRIPVDSQAVYNLRECFNCHFSGKGSCPNFDRRQLSSDIANKLDSSGKFIIEPGKRITDKAYLSRSQAELRSQCSYFRKQNKI